MARKTLCSAAVTLAIFSAPAFAQTAPAPQELPTGYGVSAPPAARPPAYPEVVAARQACAADVVKLCGTVQTGGGKVMQCVRQRRAELSPGCGSALGALRAARKAEND